LEHTSSKWKILLSGRQFTLQIHNFMKKSCQYFTDLLLILLSSHVILFLMPRNLRGKTKRKVDAR